MVHTVRGVCVCVFKIPNYARLITPQVWITETEALLSDFKVLTLPGRFKPGTPKGLA